MTLHHSLSAATLTAVLTLGAAQAETLRLSTYVNETDIRYQGFVHFAERVAALTEGRVTVEIFPSATLHSWSDGVDALQGGVSDISWIPADTRLPCYRVTSLYPAAIDLTNQIELDAAYAALIAMRDWDGRAALAGFGMPCRIIWGDRDRSYRWPQVQALWQGIAGAELAVIPAASHAAHLDKPAIFEALVQDFLDAG